MPKPPANLVVTLAISESAPTVRLNVVEGTVVAPPVAGYSADTVGEMLSPLLADLHPTISQLCERLECESSEDLWALLERRRDTIVA